MVQRQRQNHTLFTGWRGVVVGLIAFLAFALCASEARESVNRLAIFDPNARGDRGFTSERIVGRPGWERITAVTARGPAANAGLVPGQLVHFDRPYQAHSPFSLANASMAAGRTIGLVVVIPGANSTTGLKHVTLVTIPAKKLSSLASAVQFTMITYMLANFIGLALGAFAIVRGWGSITALALGLGMLSFSSSVPVPSWAIDPAVAQGMLIAQGLLRTFVAAFGCIPAALYAERIGPISKRWTVIFILYGAASLATAMFGAWCAIIDVRYPLFGDGTAEVLLVALVGYIPAIVWTRRGLRDSTGADRSRFAAIGAVLTFLILSSVRFAITLTTGQGVSQMSLAMAVALYLPGNVLVPLSLAYAVLWHRVVDLGFAINRTVVYGTFSVILLGSFGLIEWSVEHLLPEEWVKASAWIDAGAAVLVYLAFHRVHDAVEHRVEQLFFGHWQANEDALRRFVASAAHFEDERALARGFADELARFGGGARVAVYRREAGALNRVAGSWDTAPAQFRDDDPAFALMRAERRPLDLAETPTDLPGVLALPMLDHGALAGLVLMDLKNNEALYRPDEVTLLGWAAHEVGLALAALKARATDGEVDRMRIQNAELRGANAELRAVIAGWQERASA